MARLIGLRSGGTSVEVGYLSPLLCPTAGQTAAGHMFPLNEIGRSSIVVTGSNLKVASIFLMSTIPDIPVRFRIAETEGWLVNHRINSALPGYLMVSSKVFTYDLAELTSGTLAELGPLLAKIQAALKSVLGAERVYIGRYGHTPGYPIHFHVIPIYRWVEDLFWNDVRYRVLEAFAHGPGETAIDGAEMTLFVWREFCERPDPPPIKGPSVSDVVELLRKEI